MKKYLYCLALFALLGSQAAPRPEVVIADFEGKDYGGWEVTGTAFGAGPAQGALPGQMPVSGYLGHGLVNSFAGGDAATGTLTSPTFTITRRYINFLIGGGMHPGETGLILLVNGKTVRTATGPNDRPGGSERLEWRTWDVADLQSQTARIEIIDRATGGWGHINVDQITLSDTKQAEDIKTDELYNETYRPQFHFSARQHWLNDPNGLVFDKGEYHLFFQHNPQSNEWGNMTWGHAVSRDMVHWQQLPNALEPDPLGTMFSGSAVVDWHNTSGLGQGTEPPLIAIYTAAGNTSPASKGQPFTQCLAYSNDRGRTWTKYAKNPILQHIAAENRDPKVIWHEPTKQWVMALYLDKEDYALFASPDLKEWKKLQTLQMPGCSECPDFFPMPVEGTKEHKWVFTAANGHYFVGAFDGKQFTPETPVLQPDYGANYYAVQTYSDIPAKDGRRIQIAWMNNGSYPQMPFNQQMSFPCELNLHKTPDGLRLTRRPVKEISTLYAQQKQWHDVTLKPGENPTHDLSGDLWDIEATFEIGDANAVGLHVRGEDIRYDAKEQTVTTLGKKAPLKAKGNRVTLRVLADRSTLEVFGNGDEVSLTSCFLPRQKERGVGVYVEGGTAKLISLTAHALRSAWNIQKP